MNKERISTLFRNFAVRECKGSSELYEHLAMNIAQDDALLEIASNAGPGQPIPNLLFGAVQNLLLKGKEHGLREHYPNMTVGIPSGLEQAFPQFKEFCIVNKNELISLLQTKLVQTNEVRRCSYLLCRIP